ncbi:TetR/AcrR family transcriptional regulator [Nocardioides sp. Kera G14]|uniref:TetR/AcrR family transcriptional regulator n=1 Tax=Nocardioides sp. Kera G14 TaxID=2884264 RepID=UPI001D124C58|nr:TetR/AcrR family transcriptional regulator [Nocardioides sp. Kera G14]UDY23735.1 TetR/AcrR family transcriptional regulator [Nocardioides sp. Kera G14]
MDLESAPAEAQQRRRGQALQEALLDAAWTELLEHGYAGFTYDGVAKRAGTSRPVLYRRWPTKPEMLRATIAHFARTQEIRARDTGSLRGDVIWLLSQMSLERAQVMTLIMTGLAGYFEETGETFADIRNHMKQGRTSVMTEVIERAAARGELDPAKVSDRIAHLPFDLVRNELMMTLKPVSRRTIEEIVDTIFLPLVRP